MSATRCSRCSLSLLLVPSSTLWLSWGAGIKAKDANKLNKLIKKAGCVVGSELVTLEELAKDRMLTKLQAIMDHICHPSTKLWTSLKAGSATDSINPAA